MPTKNPVKVRVGKLGAAVRWAGHGGPRRVYLEDLSDPQRWRVLALVAAMRAENETRGAKP